MEHYACSCCVLSPVHNIRLGERSVFACVALRPEVHTKWTRIAYTGIEIISIPAYTHVATRVQIILYALPVATLAQVYIVNRALV